MGFNFTFQNPLYIKKVAKQSKCDCENAERCLQSLCVHCLIIAFRTGRHEADVEVKIEENPTVA